MSAGRDRMPSYSARLAAAPSSSQAPIAPAAPRTGRPAPRVSRLAAARLRAADTALHHEGLSPMDQLLTDMAGMRTERSAVSPIWMAAANDDLELVRTLAKVKPDPLNVSASDALASRAAAAALPPARRACITPLTPARAAAQENGDTPLRIAAFLGHREMVALLLEQAGPRARKGLPPVDSTRTVAGRTCYEWAQQRGHDEVAALLESDLIDQLGDGWKEQVLLKNEEATAVRTQRQFPPELHFSGMFLRDYLWLQAAAALRSEQDATLAALVEEVAAEANAEAAAEEAPLAQLAEPEPEPEQEPTPELDEDLQLDGEDEVRNVSAPGPWADSRVSPPAWEDGEAAHSGGDGVTRVQVLGKFGRKLHSIRERHELVSAAKQRVAAKLRAMAHLKPVEAISESKQKLKRSIVAVDESKLSLKDLKTPVLMMALYFLAYLGMIGVFSCCFSAVFCCFLLFFCSFCAKTDVKWAIAFLFAAPGSLSAIVVWSTIALAGATKKLLGPDHFKNWLWALYWYLNFLLALPASLMANGDTLGHSTADIGGKLFLFMLWSLGWLFLWVMVVSGKLANPTKYLDPEETMIDYEGQMTSMPTAIPFKIKLLTVAYEGYTYSGFSFFPALPWSEVPVPTGMPAPQVCFHAAFLLFSPAFLLFLCSK